MLFGSRITTHFDYVLILLILPLVFTSLYLLSETSQTLLIRQSSYAFLGIFIFLFIFFIPFRYLYKGVVVFYIICILLLLAVEVIGTTKLGAQRWINIGGFSLQPSEPVKIAVVLFLAHYVQKNPPPQDGYGWIEFLKISVFILIPFFLILIEPDLGSAIIVLVMGYGMLFIIGVHKKVWLTCIIAGLLFSPIAFKFVLKPYQVDRIMKLVSGNTSSQVQQSLIAVGSGGLTGRNYEDATQANLKFLPVATSDFIFAHFAERFGFLGSCALIALYLFIVLHLLSFCFLDSQDYFLKVIASCLAMLFFVYTSVNIAMTIELAPVVGIPLPLFSYGGSSFITFVILIAMFENATTFRFSFSNFKETTPFGNFMRIPKRRARL
ncbi:FtsW/RodA/SpoVE family cell cycle protein [Helicobacter bilis]|uniref:Rod shape-determining protein RodA n=1 Tax=Helicobacter bilis TaxID=37372 RepID=A0A4U8UAI4_9HELI|nr:FtsW/RodA/SpoVE family cell cycle protein [Helicobacter bilis]MCI7411777.1 rod shape-determining protein RodA [Helicobacter bilis]MDD7296659.1 FtsW/RodA/SpoVE family cell cycle protein [Helicobacter bilis]MDY4400471.1 FtsW/RodA/SpoVE family cell cycle protein [Helicobacter bilis]TLE09988.1 rod shape-determining protein RodA [Helicobacter bilis]TLE11798.1 rod shape-determining protein RodA [Helicobacter bilis]